MRPSVHSVTEPRPLLIVFYLVHESELFQISLLVLSLHNLLMRILFIGHNFVLLSGLQPLRSHMHLLHIIVLQLSQFFIEHILMSFLLIKSVNCSLGPIHFFC